MNIEITTETMPHGYDHYCYLHGNNSTFILITAAVDGRKFLFLTEGAGVFKHLGGLRERRCVGRSNKYLKVEFRRPPSPRTLKKLNRKVERFIREKMK